LTDKQEVDRLPPTNPLDSDSDNDGMSDGWEAAHPPLNPLVDDAGLDLDADGLTNYQESLVDTNPNLLDTDGDTLSDGAEVAYDGIPGVYNPYSTGGGDLDPKNPDTDGDTFGDGEELANPGTMDPLNPLLPAVHKKANFTKEPKPAGADLALAYEMSGGVSTNVVIESSTNLESSSWSNELQTNIALVGFYTNTVPAVPGSRVKFYRIRFSP
jgi:hypothetical protein